MPKVSPGKIRRHRAEFLDIWSVENEKAEIVTVPSDTLAQPRRLIAGHWEWRRAFSALRHRNYQFFFTGQLVSLVGTWMQSVAESWLIYQLTSSSFALGVIRFCQTIPVTALTMVGGAVADRFEKRRILILTQTVSMILAAALGALVYWKWVQAWQVALLGLFLGMANAFDIPARQSFVVEMVGKEDLMNAIALNSSMFNGARVFGPALAGVLIGITGLAVCFFLNALSFIAVIAGYLVMRLPRAQPPASHPPICAAMAEAARYLAGHRTLRAVMVLVSVVSLFGWPYSVLMPAFARDILHVGAIGYGYLMAANGCGALLGALLLATLGDYPNKRRLAFIGVNGFGASLLLFGWSKEVWLSAFALAAAGLFMIIFFATANTTVQVRVPDALRGRIMGIYSLCFLGLTPFGSLMAGSIAKAASPPFTVGLGAVVCLVSAWTVFWRVPPER